MRVYSTNLDGTIGVCYGDVSGVYGICHKIDGKLVWQRNTGPDDDTSGQIQVSEGHIMFVDLGAIIIELFERDDGIYRVALPRPVMTDGYRCGRWEGPARMKSQIIERFSQGE